jgi:hypothetical protein
MPVTTPTTTLTYLHGDQLGSTSLGKDGSGAEVWRGGYQPSRQPWAEPHG